MSLRQPMLECGLTVYRVQRQRGQMLPVLLQVVALLRFNQHLFLVLQVIHFLLRIIHGRLILHY